MLQLAPKRAVRVSISYPRRVVEFHCLRIGLVNANREPMHFFPNEPFFHASQMDKSQCLRDCVSMRKHDEPHTLGRTKNLTDVIGKLNTCFRIITPSAKPNRDGKGGRGIIAS